MSQPPPLCHPMRPWKESETDDIRKRREEEDTFTDDDSATPPSPLLEGMEGERNRRSKETELEEDLSTDDDSEDYDSL